MAGPAPCHGRSDGDDRLVEADADLGALQHQAGGDLPGLIAVPALLALVRKARQSHLPLARWIEAVDDNRTLAAWAQVTPGHNGVAIALSRWRLADGPASADVAPGEALLRQLAVAHVLLDADQRVLAVHARSAELAQWAQQVGQQIGRYWTDCVVLDHQDSLFGQAPATQASGDGERRPLHWRLLDDAPFAIAGHTRRWRARIIPRAGGSGFDLLVLPEGIAQLPSQPAGERAAPQRWNGLLGRDLAPALRQPVSRIIANAETIRTRLAGPLGDEYAAYAADIAEAGRHLLSLVEDLGDLEAVEAGDFHPSPDAIDLADCARRAAGILGVRAQERAIVLSVPDEAVRVPAIGEFRRVLQILLNLVTNAIRYAPAATGVRLAAGTDGATAWVSVADEGEGLSAEQAERVFEKFERLGRTGDGGSGLGLYISRRLARAMRGDLNVASTPGAGACFVLTLPADAAAPA